MQTKRRRSATRADGRLALAALAWLLACAAGVAAADPDLDALDLEGLMNVEVSAVARRPQKRSSTAAPTYVITGEDIRRSGLRTIPDALSLAPGVQVQRISSNQWAVGIRGFPSRLSRSVLVLMDGRSVYTPLFAGTYWEVQDTLLEDVQQIEVIRGPGGSLWGSNAVNGVVNILTKSARDTQGGILTFGGGNEHEAFGGGRHGGRLGPDLYYRVYGKAFRRDGGFDPDGPAQDDWHMGRGGFRIDWDPGTEHAARLQGDAYGGRAGESLDVTVYDPPGLRTVSRDARLSGANLLGSWQRVLEEGSAIELQAYWDTTYRREPNFRERRHTADVEAQYRLPVLGRHEIHVGAGYRVSRDDTATVESVEFDPSGRTIDLVSAFAQDEIVVLPGLLRATVGTKLERNDFSGVELQPSGRVLWTPGVVEAVWASVSRAVRTPSRVEEDLRIDTFSPAADALFRVVGDGRFQPEKILAYESGVRWRAHPRVFLDLAVFYNDYDDLLSVEPGAPISEVRGGATRTFLPYFLRNGLHGESWGGELAVDADVTTGWRIRAAYSALDLHLARDPGAADLSEGSVEHSSPRNQLVLRSMAELPGRLQLDGVFRWVDSLRGASRVPSYFDLDVRLARRFDAGFELALTGLDLVERRRLEAPGGVEVERSLYGEVRCSW